MVHGRHRMVTIKVYWRGMVQKARLMFHAPTFRMRLIFSASTRIRNRLEKRLD
jgi:hypothetical protein